MSRLILLLAICGSLSVAYAQQPNSIPDLNFDQRFTQCEKRWVVFPKKPGDSKYAYGYIYVDMMAGFTFDLKGFFTVDNDNHFIVDTSSTKTARRIFRLDANTSKVALLPVSHFNEMHIASEPTWVKLYYLPYTDTVMHNFRMGFNLNAAGDCTAALVYLQKVAKVNPHYAGLEFELAYAYNDLNQTDTAIGILISAMKNDPKNPMFYRELGYAYLKKNDNPKAIDYFKQGIEQCGDGRNDDRSEMAFNMAMAYRSTGNQDEFKNWMIKAKGWAAPNSGIYQNAVKLGF